MQQPYFIPSATYCSLWCGIPEKIIFDNSPLIPNFKPPSFSDTIDPSVTTAVDNAEKPVKLNRKEYYNKRNHAIQPEKIN